MITFTIICCLLIMAFIFVLAGFVVAATLLSGVALIVADVFIGVLLFWLAIKLARWVLHRKDARANSI